MKKSVKKYVRLIMLSVMALVFLVPVLITIIKSFQFENRVLTLKQYWELFVTNFTYFDYFWNSVLYAAVITLVCITISLPLGFVFAKIRFKGRDTLFFIYIVVMMLPFQATLLPNYIQLRDLGWLNTPMALTVPMFFSPFAVFLFRQFIRSIENDSIEYALLETSSAVKVMRYAVIPRIKPAILSLAILIFCESWNMVEQALIFSMENEEIMPLSVVLNSLPANVSYAGGTVYMFPIIVLFFMFKETLQSSMENYKL